MGVYTDGVLHCIAEEWCVLLVVSTPLRQSVVPPFGWRHSSCTLIMCSTLLPSDSQPYRMGIPCLQQVVHALCTSEQVESRVHFGPTPELDQKCYLMGSHLSRSTCGTIMQCIIPVPARCADCMLCTLHIIATRGVDTYPSVPKGTLLEV